MYVCALIRMNTVFSMGVPKLAAMLSVEYLKMFGIYSWVFLSAWYASKCNL